MRHFVHFDSQEASFALTDAQKKTTESLNYLRQNDPEEFQRIKSAGAEIRGRNQNVNIPNIQKQVAAGGNASELYKKNKEAYQQRFVQGTNADQAAGRLGKLKNTAKRYGKVAGGIAGGLVTASMLLPTVASVLPFGKKQEQEEQPPY